MATQGKHTSSIAVKRAWESILKKRVSGAFDEKCSRDLRGKDKRSERPTGIRTLSLHHPSTQTIFIGQNWKKCCWQIKYLPEHSGLLHAAYMLKLWPVQHKSIFKWLRGHIRWALVMNETSVITSATLTHNSWRPLPISCFQQSATSLVQMSGKPLCQLCRNDESREPG